MKRCISVLLCVAMLLCLLPAFSVTADDPNAISGVRLALPGELFDGSGKLLPTGRVTDLNPVCETEGVLAEAVSWYCGGVPMEIPDSALQPFTRYRVFVRLQAQGDGIFTPDTEVEILDSIQPLQGISPDGKAAYVLSPSVMTACDHSGAELRADVSGHRMECPSCFHSFDLSDHSWDAGAEDGEEILYTCTVCGESKTEAAGKKQLYKAEINAAPAVLRESIPEPTLENGEEFRIVRYQWFKGGTREEHQVTVGDSFEEDSYYLSITVRVKNPGQSFISANSYISTAGAWDEVSCTTDKDAGAITSLFSVPVYPTTTANVTLPAVTAGQSIADSLKACEVSSPEFTADLTSVMVYENGEFLGLYAETGLGFSTWTGENVRFQAGKVYTLVGTASFDGYYTDSFYIFVENPGICADLDIEGGAEALGFRATYLCPDEPAITTVAVSGIENPVGGTTPTTQKLDCEAATLYSAKHTAWQENEEAVTVFEEGRSYQAIVAVTPKRGVSGLSADTAPMLPVIVDGRLAEFISVGDAGSFLYGAAYLCDPAPHVHTWDEGEITIPPTNYEKGEIRYTCTGCGETRTEILPELTHEHSYQTIVTEPTCTEGGYTTHICECGDSSQDSMTEALGHDYQNGLCTRCGEENPNAPCRGGDDCPGRIFSDMPDPTGWAHAGIDYCVENELMNGTGGSKFNPGGTLTRAELVTILYRVESSPAAEYQGTFKDVKEGQWYTSAIEWAAANEIVKGVGDGTNFDPSGIITREQIATILYRYAYSPKVEGDLSAFPDHAAVSSYAATAMVWANQNGIINGVTSNGVTTLAPKASATREQIASIMMRYLTAE